MQVANDENAMADMGPRTRSQKSFASQGAAPKERKALGAISGNTQLAGDKPAKRPSKKSSGVPAASKSDLVVFEEGEQAAPKPAATVNEISGAISDIKFDDAGDSEALEEDPQEVSPYIDDILRLYRKTECKGLAKSGYMAEQTDINQKMREILVDWIIEVHMKFGLMPVVLYMTVQIIDRFLSRKQVSRSKLQLVGITAMFIASKFEEIYPPEVKDFVYISDKAYTGQEIVKMERAILNALKFEIVFPSVHSFGKRFAKYAKLDERTENVAFYLIDATLQNYEMLQYTPSTVAAAGVNLAERLTKRVSVATPVWTEEIAASIGFQETELEACMRDMHDLISKTADPESTLKAVTKKYSHEKFGQVAQSLTPISI